MPLTEQERQKLMGGGSAAPGMLPPEIQNVVNAMPAATPYAGSINARGMKVNVPPPQSEVERELLMKQAEQLIKARGPQPMTETERERTPMAQGSVYFLDKFAANLGLEPETDGMKNPEKLAAPMARELVPQKFQDYAMSEDSSMMYNDLESAFQLGSVVLTGRQGDIGKLQQLRDVYAFGGALKDKPKLANERYRNLRRLFQTFDRAQTLPSGERQKVLEEASHQLDSLIASSPDPNIMKLEQQFPGAKVRLKVK